MKYKSTLRKAVELTVGFTAVSLLLAGCLGGGSGGTAAAGATNVVGKFIDAAVDGLGYSCGSVTGVTANGGQFTCASGSTVTFSLGKITLGSAPVAGIITPMHLAGVGSTPASSAVQSISQLLLSLDPVAASAVAAGSSPNIISISSAVLAAANNLPALVTVGAATTPADISGWLSSIGSSTAQTFPMVSAASATAHLNKSMSALFQGAYSGNFTGAITGTWSITIDANGNVTGSGADSTGGPFTVAGAVTPTLGTANGFDFTGTGGAYTWSGTLDPATNKFSGTWGGIASNTYTGTKTAATTALTIPCNTAHYQTGAVRLPTAADMTAYAKTYNGNTGTFNTGAFAPDGGTASFVLTSSGGLTYNGSAQTVNSICKDNTLPITYVEFGTTGAVDFMADGSFTGNLPNLTGVQGVATATPPATPGPIVQGFSNGTFGTLSYTGGIAGMNLAMQSAFVGHDPFFNFYEWANAPLVTIVRPPQNLDLPKVNAVNVYVTTIKTTNAVDAVSVIAFGAALPGGAPNNGTLIGSWTLNGGAGVALNLTAKTVTFTNVTLTGNAPTTSTITLNGTYNLP